MSEQSEQARARFEADVPMSNCISCGKSKPLMEWCDCSSAQEARMNAGGAFARTPEMRAVMAGNRAEHDRKRQRVLIKRRQAEARKSWVVYKITNTVTGAVYVGSTGDFKHRRINHARDLFYRDHDNRNLQAAYDKYGAEAFGIEVIENCRDAIDAVGREQAWVEHFRRRGVALYNITDPMGKARKEQARKQSEVIAALVKIFASITAPYGGAE